MKISKSRKSVQSIMCNPHFGGVLIKEGDIEMYVPEGWILSDGRLKGYAVTAWKRHKKEVLKQRQKKVV